MIKFSPAFSADKRFILIEIAWSSFWDDWNIGCRNSRFFKNRTATCKIKILHFMSHVVNVNKTLGNGTLLWRKMSNYFNLHTQQHSRWICSFILLFYYYCVSAFIHVRWIELNHKYLLLLWSKRISENDSDGALRIRATLICFNSSLDEFKNRSYHRTFTFFGRVLTSCILQLLLSASSDNLLIGFQFSL